MGRGRVEMKMIENKVNRQVTFSKRRNGLMKKASELSVLCDAEVALIIFSSGGKVYEFGSHDSGVMHTLERYKHCCSTIAGTSIQYETKLNMHQTQTMQNWEQEIMKLKARLQSLERTQRNLHGEDLESLNLKELQSLEKQLEEALALTRQRKTQFMREQLEELRRRERYLGELNKQLKIKVQIEAIGLGAEGLWNGCTMEGSSSYATHQFQPSTMDCKPEPILQIGYADYVPLDEGPSEQKGKMVAENEFMQEVWDPLSSESNFKLFRG